MPDKFYQYTIIDEANRERFIYPFREQSSYSTVEFVNMTIKYFKYQRSHRNDNERFYRYLKFYSYDDLIVQMKRYLYKSNRLPMQVLGWLSPIEMRKKIVGD